MNTVEENFSSKDMLVVILYSGKIFPFFDS